MNKAIFILFIVCLSFFSAYSQVNLVGNPSFEDTVNCPMGPAAITYSAGWVDYWGSPDYMNACSSFGMGVPQNWGGFQYASSGVAYAALATYSSASGNAREYLGRQLSTSLSMATKYYVSFRINLSMGGFVEGNCATNKMGAKFLTIPFSDASLTSNYAHVYSNTVIVDTANWTMVFGSFIADSNYNYILIGNFFDDSNTNVSVLSPSTTDLAYYYVDDICVSTDSAYAAIWTEINETYYPDVYIFPNPASSDIIIKTEEFPYDLEFYDIMGRSVYRETGIKENAKKIDCSFLPNGIIFMRYNNDRVSLVKKIVIEK